MKTSDPRLQKEIAEAIQKVLEKYDLTVDFPKPNHETDFALYVGSFVMIDSAGKKMSDRAAYDLLEKIITDARKIVLARV